MERVRGQFWDYLFTVTARVSIVHALLFACSAVNLFIHSQQSYCFFSVCVYMDPLPTVTMRRVSLSAPLVYFHACMR